MIGDIRTPLFSIILCKIILVCFLFLGSSTVIVSQSHGSSDKENTQRSVQETNSINRFDSFGYTPLMHALPASHMSDFDLDVVETLLEKGADPNLCDKNNRYCPLSRAIIFVNDVRAVQVLLDAGADVHHKSHRGMTPLMFAANFSSGIRSGTDAEKEIKNNEKILNLLIRSGADVNAVDSTGGTALNWAAIFNRNPAVFSALLEAGANVHGGRPEKETPLTVAARNGTAEILQLLLEAGANKNFVDYEGYSPFDRAQENHRIPKGSPVLAALRPEQSLARPTDFNLRDSFIALCATGTVEQVRAALDTGASATARNVDGITPLNNALRNKNNPDVIVNLVQNGADPEEMVFGRIPLYRTAILSILSDPHPDHGILSALIRAGAKLDGLEEDIMSPPSALIQAAKYTRDPAVITILLEAGADKRATDRYDFTAFDHALKNSSLRNNSEILAALKP